MKGPTLTPDAALDPEDIQHAGEIAAPPATVADPVPPPIAPQANANRHAAAMASNKPLWQTFLLFLAPMLLSNILQSLSGTLNNVYLGQMIGVGAMAAVSSFFPMMFFFIAFTIGLGAGASVLIGQAWGARELDKARAVAGTTLTVGVLFGLCVAVFGGAFTQPMLAALGTPADILPDATRYARIILIAMPGLFVFLLSTAMLRGVGDTVAPLYTLLISTGLGVVITPALIRGWFGLPQLGVASGASATVVAFVVATTWLAFHLRRKKSPLAPDADFVRHLRVRPKLLLAVLKVGVPTGVQMIVVSLAELVLLSFVNSYGSNATAAYGAVNQVVAYVQFPAISIAITASILGAQAIGAGQVQRLGAITRTALLMNLVLTGALVLLGYLFSRSLMGFFITSDPVIEVAQTLLHIMLWSTVIFGMGSALSGIMRASGSVLVPTSISIFCIALIEVPVAWWFSHRIGLNGIWIAYPAAFISMLTLQACYYRFVWRKKAIRRLI
ncbi:Staphylococcal virulence regulator protein A [Variovorax sp. PBL-E5]|nr:Staphylococcal virulence regulator protein A [Variovorax sp. PBL-E5]